MHNLWDILILWFSCKSHPECRNRRGEFLVNTPRIYPTRSIYSLETHFLSEWGRGWGCHLVVMIMTGVRHAEFISSIIAYASYLYVRNCNNCIASLWYFLPLYQTNLVSQFSKMFQCHFVLHFLSFSVLTELLTRLVCSFLACNTTIIQGPPFINMV